MKTTKTSASTDYSWGSPAWYNYSSLIEQVLLPDGLTTIGGYAFYGCTGLTEITIPASVTSIRYDAFVN